MGLIEEKEQAVYRYMQEYFKKNGTLPNMREIQNAVQISSLSTVHTIFGRLNDKKLIRQIPGRHSYTLAADENDAPEFHGEICEIPIIGRVAAGQPILAEQNIDAYFPLPAGNLGRGNNFMLTVHGNSMIEAGILDGDYVLVEEQQNANDGDIVVAMVEGMDYEATVKEFHKENGRIRLQPKNSSMEPIIVDDCRVIGKVKGVFRYLN